MKTWQKALIVLVAVAGGTVGAAVTFRSAIPFGTASSWSTATGSDPSAVQGVWVDSNQHVVGHVNGADWQLDQPIYNVQRYGAKIDGSTDDAAAINSAITAANGGTVFIPDGNVKLGSSITISVAGTTLILGAGTYTSTANPVINVTAGNVTVVGKGYFGTQVFANSATNDVVLINGGAGGISGVTVRDMTITAHSNTNTRTSGFGVHLIKVGNWRLNGLYIRDPWIGIDVDNASTGFAEDITMDTTLAAQSIQYGVLVNDNSVSNHFARVLVTSAATAIDTGFYIDGATDTFDCVDCTVQASGTGGASFGFKFAFNSGAFKARWIKLVHPWVEVAKTTGIGLNLDQVTDIEITDPYLAWGINNVQVSVNAKNISIKGGMAQLAYQYGVLVNGGTNIVIDGLNVDSASQQTNTTYDGIALGGGSNIKVVNCTSGNSFWAGSSPASASNFQRYGIFTNNATDYYWIANNNLQNTLGTGGMSDTATGTHKIISGNSAAAALGGQIGHVTTVADTAYTANLGDYVIAYTSLTAGRTVTLPAPGTGNGQAQAGTAYIVKNESAGAFAITISPASGTCDGAASCATAAAGRAAAVRVYSDGSNYYTW